MSHQNNQDSGRLPVSAGLILGLLCLLWGAQSVSIKFSNQGMPPLMAAALRSLVAGVLVWVYARMKRRGVTFPSGQTRHACNRPFIRPGVSFFILGAGLHPGLTFAHLSLHPSFLGSLGAHFLLKNDRLTPTKLFGLVLAFGGGGGGVSGSLAETAPLIFGRGCDGAFCCHFLGRHYLVY